MKRTRTYWKSFRILFLFWGLAGCTATSEPSRFYLLNSLSPTEQVRSKSARGLAIGIGPIEIPEYVDRPQIVTRISANELNLTEFHKWAEPLKDNIPQVLADNLSVLLQTDQIAMYPWKRNTAIDYQATLDITRFDTEPNGHAHLMARWQLFGQDTRTLLATNKSHFTTPIEGSDYTAMVSALNQALHDLSRAMAQSISQVHTNIQKP